MAIALASPRASAAQGCLPADVHAESLRAYALKLAEDTSAEMDSTRKHYGLVKVPAREVQIVTDKKTCAAAARAFDRDNGAKPKSPRRVHVVRIGKCYIVTDPDALMGEFQMHEVYDKNFKRLAGFAG